LKNSKINIRNFDAKILNKVEVTNKLVAFSAGVKEMFALIYQQLKLYFVS